MPFVIFRKVNNGVFGVRLAGAIGCRIYGIQWAMQCWKFLTIATDAKTKCAFH